MTGRRWSDKKEPLSAAHGELTSPECSPESDARKALKVINKILKLERGGSEAGVWQQTFELDALRLSSPEY